MKKILILYASIGNGHEQLARTLAQIMEANYVDEISVELVDALKSRRLNNAIHFILTTFLGPLYNYVWHANGILRNIAGWTVHLSPRRKKFVAALRARQPQAVICTHTLPAIAITSYWPNHPPLIAISTDQNVHSQWPSEIDAFLVANENARQTAIRYGIAPRRVYVTGIPVKVPEAAAAPGQPTRVLIIAGGRRLAPYLVIWPHILRLVRALRRTPVGQTEWHLITGSNKALPALLHLVAPQLSERPDVHYHPYIPDLPTFMATCTLIITKPGGITTAEILALGKPAIVLTQSVGQERENAEALLRAGAGELFDKHQPLMQIQAILSDPQRLEAMQHAARQLGRADAAQHAVKIIMEMMP